MLTRICKQCQLLWVISGRWIEVISYELNRLPDNVLASPISQRLAREKVERLGLTSWIQRMMVVGHLNRSAGHTIHLKVTMLQVRVLTVHEWLPQVLRVKVCLYSSSFLPVVRVLSCLFSCLSLPAGTLYLVYWCRTSLSVSPLFPSHPLLSLLYILSVLFSQLTNIKTFNI